MSDHLKALGFTVASSDDCLVTGPQPKRPDRIAHFHEERFVLESFQFETILSGEPAVWMCDLGLLGRKKSKKCSQMTRRIHVVAKLSNQFRVNIESYFR